MSLTFFPYFSTNDEITSLGSPFISDVKKDKKEEAKGEEKSTA